ncbi:MAG: hypothetical protein D6754_14550 [Alphaproteobacteria bacterium]|nr:MAG: hypothetical protein D6754_14550 [Alphaproteobacteria bacterium]
MIADMAAVRIEAPAETVFAFLADPGRLDLWSFGTWSTTRHPDGLIEGRALQDGARIWLRIAADADALLIDYHLGATPQALAPRIFARIVPGRVTGHGADCATLILTALRSAEMDDERWGRLIRAHAFELDLVKSLIETGHDHRAVR